MLPVVLVRMCVCVCVCVVVVVVVVATAVAAVVVFSLVIRRALAADAGKDLHFLVYGKSEDRYAIKCIPIHILLMFPVSETC